MKHTKMFVLFALCMVLLFACCTAFVACDGNHTQQKFSLTLEFDSTQGSVTASAPAEGDKYANGEQVTVTVAPAEGNEISAFKVNGVDAEIPRGGGAYRFDIKADTTVTVTFTKKTPETFSVTVNKAPLEGGVVRFSSDGPYVAGSTVQVEILPNKGFNVQSVTVDGVEQPLTNGKFELEVNKSVTIAVTFSEIKATVTLKEGVGAHLSLEPSATKEEDGSYSYRVGTQLTVGLEFDDGYALSEFTVGGEKVTQVQDSEYTFELVEDVEIELTATRPFTQEMLSSLKGSVIFDGSLSIKGEYEMDDHETTLFTAFYPDRDLIWQKEVNKDGSTYAEYLFEKMDDGSAGIRTHNIFTGKAEVMPTAGVFDIPITFASLCNAFENLTVDDFDYSDGAWHIASANKQTAVLETLTGYSFDIVNFDITKDNGKISIKIDGTGENDYGDPLEISVVLDASSQVPTIPDHYLSDYTSGTEVKPLLDALAASKSTENYTVKYTVTDDYGDETNNIYRADGVLWIAEEDDGTGYVLRPDGSTWEFYIGYSNQKMKLSDEADESFDYYVASFDLGGLFSGMFTVNDKGNFVLRDFDLNGPYSAYLAIYAAMSFDHGDDYYAPASSALDIEISVKDGKIDKVSFDYYDDLYEEYGTAEFAFSAYGTTVIPVDIDEDLIKGIMPKEFVGHWVNDEDGFELFVELDSVAVNDAYDTTEKIIDNKDGSYTATFDDGDYTIKKEGDKLVVTDPDGAEHRLRFMICDWEKFLGEYFGVAYDEEFVRHDITVKVEPKSVTILIDDEDYIQMDETDLSYYDEDGQLVGWYNYSGRFEFDVMDLNYNVFACLTDELQLRVYRKDIKVDLASYKGVYENKEEGIKVEIKDNAIDVYLPDVPTLTPATDIYIAEYASSRGGTATLISFMVESYGITLQVLSENKLLFYEEDDAYEECVLVKGDFVASYEKYIGEYKEIGNDAHTLKIEQDKITIVLGEKTYTFTNFVYYDVEYYDPVFLLTDENGNEFWLQQYGKIFGYMNFYNYPENDPNVYFVKNDFVMDTTEFAGTYDGSDAEGNTYRLVITDSDWTLSKNGKQLELTKKMFNRYLSENGTFFYNFDFDVDGQSYIMQPAAEMDGKTCLMYIATKGASEPMAELYLDRYTKLDSWTEYEGKYVGDGFEIVITAEGATVKLAGDAVSVTEFAFGKNFDYSAQKWYFICDFTHADKSYTMIFVDDAQAAVLIENGTEEATDKFYFVISDKYSFTADYHEAYQGYYEDADGSYAVKLTKDELTVSKDGNAWTVEVLYFSVEGGVVFTSDGNSYRLVLQLNANGDLYLKMFDTAEQKQTDLLSASEPVTDFTKYMGTYNGTQDDNTYEVVIGQSSLTFSINGKDVPVTKVKLAADPTFGEGSMVFSFVADGVSYQMDVGSLNTMTLHSKDYKVYVILRLDEGNEQVKFVGKWSAVKDDATYTIDFIEDGGTFYLNDSKQEATFTWNSADSSYSIKSGETVYTAKFSDGKVKLTAEGLDLTLSKVETALPECTWSDYIGVWSAVDEYTVTVTITETQIHINYHDEDNSVSVDYVVDSTDFTFTDGENNGFRWVHDGRDGVSYNWMLKIQDDGSLYFSDVDESNEDIYYYLSNEQ